MNQANNDEVQTSPSHEDFKPLQEEKGRSANERNFPTLTKQAVRELVKSFNEFLEKSKSDIHYELWKDDGGLQHLTVSALARSSMSEPSKHVIRYEFVGDPNRGETDQYLLRQLADLEVEFGVKITPGKWY
jgi:hypothetical protein